jgi:hypothetical protein
VLLGRAYVEGREYTLSGRAYVAGREYVLLGFEYVRLPPYAEAVAGRCTTLRSLRA